MGTLFYQTTVVRHFPLARLTSKAQPNYRLSPMLHIAEINYVSSVAAMNTCVIKRKTFPSFSSRTRSIFPQFKALYGVFLATE